MSNPSATPFLTSATRQLYADPAAAARESVDKIAAARVWLLKEKPFFGVLARALAVEAVLRVPAFRLTEDDRLLVNPLIVLELRFPSLCARMAHVCLHAALGAFARRGTREPLRWNAAHDLAIAPLLRAAGFAAASGTLVSIGAGELALGLFGGPEQGNGPSVLAAGASAEEYYAILPEGARPGDMWCDLSDVPSPDDAPPAGNFTRQDDGQGNDPAGPEPSQGGDEAPRDAEGDEEDDAPEEEPSPLEMRARELQWKMRLGAALEEEAASGGKTFGELPAWIEELVRATVEPPPDWSAELQRSVSMLARTNRTFLRPSRRLAALAEEDGSWPSVVAMPGRRIVPAGKLVAVVDTSASIDAATLARFFGGLVSIATAEGFDEIRLVQADADVTRDETVFAADLLFQNIAVFGRGGTDFGPALRLLALESRRSGEHFTVVYLTDLEGRFPKPEDARPLEVLWVVPGKAAKAPPFGRVLEMAFTRR